jgi:hypothetical protein
MMERLEDIADEMRGTVTFRMNDGRFVRLDARAVREYGAARILRDLGYGAEMPTERVAVVHHGRKVGTLPPDFDPISIKSQSFLYDPRPGDFRREGDVWIASDTIGLGDLEAVPNFVYDLR